MAPEQLFGGDTSFTAELSTSRSSYGDLQPLKAKEFREQSSEGQFVELFKETSGN